MKPSASNATINIGRCCTWASPWDTTSSASAGTPTAAPTSYFSRRRWFNSDGAGERPAWPGGWESPPAGSRRPFAVDFQEIPEQLRPLDSEKTLRMELNAVQRPGAVPHAHDLAFLSPGANDEVRIAER